MYPAPASHCQTELIVPSVKFYSILHFSYHLKYQFILPSGLIISPTRLTFLKGNMCVHFAHILSLAAAMEICIQYLSNKRNE